MNVSSPSITFTIYHVHGYLPDPRRISASSLSSIVFAYDEYVDAFANTFSWQTSTQLHLLHKHPCLFVGASLNDWNMLRLLQMTTREEGPPLRYAVTKRGMESSAGMAASTNVFDRIRATLWNSVGVHPIVVGPNYSCIPRWLEHFRAELSRFSSSSAADRSPGLFLARGIHRRVGLFTRHVDADSTS
jgi:hypothetical protein